MPLVAQRGLDLLTAPDVVLVVEFVSPGSLRTDNIVKRGELARIDLDALRAL